MIYICKEMSIKCSYCNLLQIVCFMEYKEFTFKSFCRCLTERMIFSWVLENDDNPAVLFYGELNDIKKEYQINVEMTCTFNIHTKGGKKSSDQIITAAILDDLPNWREQAAWKTPGVLPVFFVTQMIDAEGDMVTVLLPEYYNDEYRPTTENAIKVMLTKEISEKNSVAAMKIRKKQLEMIGFKFEDYFQYPCDLFDFENGRLNTSVIENCTREDIDAIRDHIKRACRNDVTYTIDKLGKKKIVEIWADWNYYGYKDIKEVPLDETFMLDKMVDSFICYSFYKSRKSFENFISNDTISVRIIKSTALYERLSLLKFRKEDELIP